MDIYKYEISDILKELPDLEPLNIEMPSDLFLCTVGFEDRTHSIIDEYCQTDFAPNSQFLFIKYPTNKKDNDRNLPFFQKAGKKMAGMDDILYSRGSYTQKLKTKLQSLISKCSFRVIFDISTCSSYVFYPTLSELMKYDIDLTIVYSEADTYFPIKDEWENVNKKAKEENSFFIESFENAKFQSTGVDDLYAYSPFSEFNSGNKPSLLVAVPNFSAKRMNAIVHIDRELNKTPYGNIIWLIGEPPAEKNKWRIDAIKRTNNIVQAQTHFVSTLKHKEMILELEDIWSNSKYDYHMTIGSLGSKMQHLGTFFFLALHQEIGLWLAEPKEFNAERFSTGYGPLWQLRFGKTSELWRILKKYMTFRWKL